MRKTVEFMGSVIELQADANTSTTIYKVYQRSYPRPLTTEQIVTEVRFSPEQIRNQGEPDLLYLRTDKETLHRLHLLIDGAPIKIKVVRTEELKQCTAELIQFAEDQITQTTKADAGRAVLASLGFK